MVQFAVFINNSILENITWVKIIKVSKTLFKVFFVKIGVQEKAAIKYNLLIF